MDVLTRRQNLESFRMMRETWPEPDHPPFDPLVVALRVLDARPELLPHWKRPREKKVNE